MNALRRTTAADVARAAGVSRATVGYVLNDTPGQTISEATRQRVLTASQTLGYRPHRAARALATGESRVVLLVLPDWPIDYSMRANLDEASLVLDEAGYTLVTTTTHPTGRAQPLWETLSPDVVLGLLPFSRDELHRMQSRGVARIVPDIPLDEESLDPDAMAYSQGPRRQIEHLLERGKTRLAFAGSTEPRIGDIVRERRDMARRTYRDLTGNDLLGDADVDDANVAATLDQWLGDRIDGIVAYNADVAALLAGTALRKGIEIPRQLAVIGHDDTPIARSFVPALSSIHVDCAGLGRYLAQLALAAMDGTPAAPQGLIGDAKVIQRETT